MSVRGASPFSAAIAWGGPPECNRHQNNEAPLRKRRKPRSRHTLSRTLLLLSSSCVLTHGCCLFQSDGRRVEGVPRSQRRAYMACATVLTAAATCSDALACALSCRVMRDGSGNDIERVTSCMLCFAMHAPRSLASRRTQPHLVKSILEYVILAGSLQRPYISTAYVAVYRMPHGGLANRTGISMTG